MQHVEAHPDSNIHRNRAAIIMIVIAGVLIGWANARESGSSAIGGLGALIAILSAIPMRHLKWRLLLYVPIAWITALALGMVLTLVF